MRFWFRPPPFRLKKGLYLETANILLPWRATERKLKRSAHEDVGRHRKIHLVWRNELAFGGLPVIVTYQPNLASLGRIFDLGLADHARTGTSRGDYEFVVAHLTARLGQPHEHAIGDTLYDEGCPRSTWKYGRVTVMALTYVRFMEEFNLQVRRHVR